MFRSELFSIRLFRLGDVDSYAAHRSDLSTAMYQSWTAPYPRDKAQESVEVFMAAGCPTEGQWFSFGIGDPLTDELIGDVAVLLEWGGRSATIGYNVDPRYRRRGIATGAIGWVIDHLFCEFQVHRVHASVHPDNTASMVVLERLGFVYEGTARQSFWVDTLCTDDVHFGLLQADWDRWNTRPRKSPAVVELREVVASDVDDVTALATHRSQERFVPPMGKTVLDALVPDVDENGGRLVPWFRAIVADSEIVGFVMVASVTKTLPDPILWRLLIDRMHQRRGIGFRVLDLLVETYRAAGHTQLLASWKVGTGSPEPMYLRYGFVLTGEDEEGEVVGSFDLTYPL